MRTIDTNTERYKCGPFCWSIETWKMVPSHLNLCTRRPTQEAMRDLRECHATHAVPSNSQLGVRVQGVYLATQPLEVKIKEVRG